MPRNSENVSAKPAKLHAQNVRETRGTPFSKSLQKLQKPNMKNVQKIQENKFDSGSDNSGYCMSENSGNLIDTFIFTL